MRILRQPTVVGWLVGNLISNSGNWLFNVTAAIVTFEISGSVLAVGLVSAVQYGSSLLASPFAGILVDRWDRRWVLFVGLLLGLLPTAALGLWVLSVGQGGLPGAWAILAPTLFVGISLGVSGPAVQTIVPSLVGERDLERIVALTSSTFNLGRAVGPALGGLLLATVGPGWAFMANALSFIPLMIVLVWLRPTGNPVPRAATSGILGGLRIVRNDKRLVILLSSIVCIGFAIDPVVTLSPAMSAELAGHGRAAAILVAAFGAGAILAVMGVAPLNAMVGNRTTASLGASITFVALIVTALSPTMWLAIGGHGFMGVGYLLAMTSLTSAIHRLVSDETRGRVMAWYIVALLGSRPLAAMIDGAVAEAFGPRVGYILPAAVLLIGALRLHRTPLLPRTPTAV